MPTYPRFNSLVRARLPTEAVAAAPGVYDAFMAAEVPDMRVPGSSDTASMEPAAGGGDAFAAGARRSTNPHAVGDAKWADWMDGWDQARSRAEHPLS